MQKLGLKAAFCGSVISLCVLTHAADYVSVPSSELPIAYSVDVVVVGANEGGVAAAIAAGKKGSEVLLVSSEYYVGSQLTKKLRCWLNSDESSQSEIAQSLLGSVASGSGNRYVTPADFKLASEDALEDASVRFLFKSYGVNVVTDGDGALAGVVIANKAGRQVVIAKTVIDATQMGGVARIAGSEMTSWGTPTVDISRSYRPSRYQQRDKGDEWVEDMYVISHHDVTMANGSWVERCNASNTLRQNSNISFMYAANHVHYVEPAAIVGKKEYSETAWSGGGGLDLDYCRPKNLDNLYVIGSCVGISREHAVNLTRPLDMIELGERIGDAAHADASQRSTPTDVSVQLHDGGSAAAGLHTQEKLQGLRPGHVYSKISMPEDVVPVWAEYDVVVVGGGTSGCPAAISAARQGAKVLLIEMHGLLGGTRHGILGFYRGYTHGFNQEVDYSRKLRSVAKGLYNEVTDAGVDVWFNTLACGAIKNDSKVRGVVVATPMGRGAVLADVVIDASGDGDVATHAGAQAQYNSGDMNQFSTTYFVNCDPPDNLLNEWPPWSADPWDIYGMTWFHVLSRRRDGFYNKEDKYEFYPLCGFRGTRRIVGEHMLSVAEERISRPFADGINMAVSNYDMHGIPISEPGAYAGVMAPPGENMEFIVPYRSILPKGLQGLLMVGRCMSATNDGLASARMEPDVINQGYAAGYIAAHCSAHNTALRDIDINAVQDHLVSVGNISASLRSEKCKGWDVSDSELESAAQDASSDVNAALLIAQGERSVAFLKSEFNNSPDKATAKILSILGDNTAVDYLANWLDNESLSSSEGQEAYGGANTIGPDIDGVIWGLGMTKDERAVSALTNKLDELGAVGHNDENFSHLRAITGALGMIGSVDAVAALEAYLQKSGVQGHTKQVEDNDAHGPFEPALGEVYAAAALYRCGDTDDELGKKILQEYTKDWRGPLVRYTTSVLSGEDVPVAGESRPHAAAFKDVRSSIQLHTAHVENTIELDYGFYGKEHLTGIRIYNALGNTVWHNEVTERHAAEGKMQWQPERPIPMGVYILAVHTNYRTINYTLTIVE